MHVERCSPTATSFERRQVTTAFSDLANCVTAAPGVYPPQHDSLLLIDVMERRGRVAGRRVADLCTGSGVIAISAARLGAATVTAVDLSARAVECARANVQASGVAVDVRHGSWTQAAEFGPFDLVVSNPPYVPVGGDDDTGMPDGAGPAEAFDAGADGRLVLDPLCASAPGMLADGGTLLLVHSEFAGVERTVAALRTAGLRTEVITRQCIPFGPVMTSRAPWLERSGRLDGGRRTESLAVIEAVRR